MLLLALLCVGLFAGMLALLELGRRLGRRRGGAGPVPERAGLGTVDGAVFALLGLLVAFTFAAAFSRLEARRHGTLEEANAISTAWLRLDLLPAAAQTEVRARMRDYVDARLAAFRALPDRDAMLREVERAHQLQNEIWSRSVAAISPSTADRSLPEVLLPALNSMFDQMTLRVMATQARTPPIILGLLVVLALGCALLAGHGMAGSPDRNLIHSICFAAVTSATVYVILDVEHPRLGLIRIDPVDQVLEEVRAGMR